MEQKTKTTKEKKSTSNVVATPKHHESKTEGLIAIIRIKGEVKVKPDVLETFNRLRLRRKYSCVLINPNSKDMMGMLNTVKFNVAYGIIDKDMLIKLIQIRGQKIGDAKIDAHSIVEELYSGKKLSELNLKPFFRLHPPRKGIKSKLQYPKGVLGNNKSDINKLIERML